MRARPSLSIFFLLGSLGCAEESGLTFTGMPGAPITARMAGNLFFVEASVAGSETVLLLADTGAPIMLVSHSVVPQSSGIQANVPIETLGLSFTGVPIVKASAIVGTLDGVGIAGIMGCTILCEFSASFDYRGSTLTLDRAAPPGDVEAPVELPFELAGGGVARLSATSSELVSLPRSRVLVEATIEGRTKTLLVDTGASLPVVRSSLFQELAGDGRATLSTFGVGVMGRLDATLARARSMAIGGVELQGVVFAGSTDVDRLLDAVSQETARTVDGVLGGTWLREHDVTIDYAAQRLVLRRYAARDHIVDEYMRVGVDVGGDDPEEQPFIIIEGVAPGSDAEAQGIKRGDIMLEIDAETALERSRSELALLLAGQRGGSRTIRFGCPPGAGMECTSFEGTKQLAIDHDLLPLE